MEDVVNEFVARHQDQQYVMYLTQGARPGGENC